MFEKYSQEDYDKITAWKDAAAELARLRGLEAKLRREVLATFCPEREEGTNKVALPHGWTLNVKQPYSYKVDEAAVKDVLANIPPHLAEDLVRMKPELNKRLYSSKSMDNFRDVFDQALTIKPGSASVELVAPKEPQ